MQKILEAKDHTERLKLVRYFVVAETKRLNTKKALKGMFSGTAASIMTSESAMSQEMLSSIPPEELVPDESSSRRPQDEKASQTNVQSSFFSDEDAFQ